MNIDELKKELSFYFYIAQQLGRTGASTMAFDAKDKDGKRCVILFKSSPVSVETTDSYMKRQKEAEEKKDFFIAGYTGDVFIPKAQIMENYRIMPYAGEDLTEDVYRKLSQSQKLKIAKDFAEFLNFVHQKSFKEKAFLNQKIRHAKIGEIDKIDDCEPEHKPDLCLSSLLKLFQPHISDKEYEHLENLCKTYLNRSKADEKIVMTHGDLRYQNVLYNQETQKLAIIDFESAKPRSLYRDFCPTVVSRLPKDFLENVIYYYNKAPKKEPLYVNPKKIKLFWKINYLHEHLRCAKRDPSFPIEKRIKMFSDFESKIDKSKPVPEVCPLLKIIQKRTGKSF